LNFLFSLNFLIFFEFFEWEILLCLESLSTVCFKFIQRLIMEGTSWYLQVNHQPSTRGTNACKRARSHRCVFLLRATTYFTR
jgi:hypothetical protein